MVAVKPLPGNLMRSAFRVSVEPPRDGESRVLCPQVPAAAVTPNFPRLSALTFPGSGVAEHLPCSFSWLLSVFQTREKSPGFSDSSLLNLPPFPMITASHADATTRYYV